MKDDLGDRQKMYESVESERRLMPLLPALARIDGRCFNSFTRNMARPFDYRMINLMVDTTKWLVKETNATVGYTQSDEITLAWYSSDHRSQIFFDGRIQKMASQLAALATLYFYSSLQAYFDGDFGLELISKYPTFDARVWNVPNLIEATNCFLWREWDATKNSVSMAARCYFSHKELQDKNTKEMQEMLWSKHDINWNDYQTEFKRGTYVQRKIKTSVLTPKELENLPEKHEARKNPNIPIERSEIAKLNLPRLASIHNRVEVLFNGEDPVVVLA